MRLSTIVIVIMVGQTVSRVFRVDLTFWPPRSFHLHSFLSAKKFTHISGGLVSALFHPSFLNTTNLVVFPPIPLTLFSIPDDSTLSIFLQFSTYYPLLHCLQLCVTQIACLSSTVIFSCCFLTLSNICTKTFLPLPFKPNLLNPRDLTIPCQLILNLKLNPTLCFVYCQLFFKKETKI